MIDFGIPETAEIHPASGLSPGEWKAYQYASDRATEIHQQALTSSTDDWDKRVALFAQANALRQMAIDLLDGKHHQKDAAEN